MDKKVVVVTGANGDLGIEITKLLLNSGYLVVACVRNIETLSQFDSDDLYKCQCDLLDIESIKLCSKEIKKEFKAIYGLVNCAGVAYGNTFMLTKEQEHKNVFELNYFAPIFLAQQLVRKMIKKREGRVISISSTASILSDSGTMAYGSAKSALNHSSRVMATELGPMGITVNTIAPAVVESKMARLMDDPSIRSLNSRAKIDNVIMPSEIADMVKYLLSESARNITGQTLIIDRGITS